MKLCLQLTVMSIYQVTVVDTSVRSSLSRLCVPSQRNVVFFPFCRHWRLWLSCQLRVKKAPRNASTQKLREFTKSLAKGDTDIHSTCRS